MRNTDPWGIDHIYEDGRKEKHHVSRETIAALRAAMNTGDQETPPEPHLKVIPAGAGFKLDAPCDILLEDGASVRAESRLPPDLPLGYHTLRPLRGTHAETALIVTPPACYLPPSLRIWGWALQLYSLRSRASWGMGDFADLREFAHWAVTDVHAGLVMTNPVNAAAPGKPQQSSPYSPTSRIYRNLLYLRIPDIDGARDHLPNFSDLLTRAGRLNGEPVINRDAIYDLKLEALSALWPRIRQHVDLRAYEKQEGPQLDRFAAWCVLAEKHGPDWREWPAEIRSPAAPGVARLMTEQADRIRFHKWIQLLLEQQLGAVTAEPVIMQDLPIGVDPAGADGWAWQHIFAQGVSVGAPPDIFNTQGQDWGLQPFIPWKLRAACYEPFIRTVRANMRHSAGLRIDHVMGLFRLFWIPQGAEKKNGTYVRYRWNELLSILALESVRSKAFIVGEDLGTVEEGVREALAEKKVLSYRVLWFEEEPPRKYPVCALSAVTTHDLPTIAGLWTGADLEEQQRLGLKPNVEGTEESRKNLQAVTATDDSTPLREVIVKTYAALAEAPSAILIASMEDALGVKERPNLPGTLTDIRPNWSMPLPQPLEQFEQDPLVLQLAATLNARS